MPEIEIQFRTEAEYHRLRSIRDKYGVQWRGMLIQGAKHLEGRDTWFVPPDDESRGDQLSARGTEFEDPQSRSTEEPPDPQRYDSHTGTQSTSGDQDPNLPFFDSRGSLRIVERNADREPRGREGSHSVRSDR
jgi:hypothetical protein